MEICSIEYLLACGALVIVFQLLPLASLRRVFLGIVNCVFLLPFLHGLQICVWFAVFFFGTYAALVLVRARPRGIFVWTAIVTVVAFFAYVRKYSFIPLLVPVELWWKAWAEPMAFVGLSYMLFKFIHMLVDEWQRQLAPFTFSSYLNYQLAFFTLIAGPIQRYNDFKRGWDNMDFEPADPRQSALAWNRIAIGLLKMRLIAPLILDIMHRFPVTDSHDPNRGWSLLLAFYGYPAQLYFNFSGYTDAAIGSAQLLGFRLPENFDRPYLARNLIDFWNRWHMSLTHFIRDYVFMVSYKAAATNFPRWARAWGYGLLFLALFITGIWHGTPCGFAVFGILHGMAAAVNRAYGDVLKATLGRAGVQRYLNSPLIRLVAIVATFHYVCFTFLAFASGISLSWWAVFTDVAHQAIETAQALVHLPATTAVAAALAFALILAAGVWKSDAVGNLMARLTMWLTNGSRLNAVLCAQIGVLVVLFLFDATFQQEPPQVIYMRF
jgi:D-alanyl-lipoteichoic acid acyltransferase DltB (MBOAT superfamily)